MQRLFKNINEWKIIQDEIEIKENRLAESIMSIGNGYMGMRGNYEEYYSKDSHRGSYIAGIWYPDKTRVGWWKNGYPEYFGKVPNSVNFIGIDIYINGKQLDLAKFKIKSFYRELDMKNGVLSRKFTVDVDGYEIEASVTRFLSIVTKELGTIKYDIKALNFSGEVMFVPYLDSNVKNEDSNYEENFWVNLESNSNENYGNIVCRTKENIFNTEIFTVCAAMGIKSSKKPKEVTFKNKEYYSSNTIVLDIEKDETVGIEKYVAITTTRDYNENELIEVANKILVNEISKGYETILKEQCNAWNKRWESADINIRGNQFAQQGIRYNLFQLFSTYYGDDARLNIGPKGFTGEKYGGATYWDTEAYCLSLYLATTNKEIGKNLLTYRHNQLQQAKDNAKQLGLSGALYPMVTFNGVECHNEWEITFEEIHRNASMVYAIYNYTTYNSDNSYIKEKGIDIIVEVARFWESRVHYSPRKEMYMIHGVTGPNEYENNVNNNWYTNYMAKWCLEYACENIEMLKIECPEAIDRNHVTIEESSNWLNIAQKMYLPYDKDLDIFVQHDTYLDKEFIKVNELSKENLPLNQNWSWDKILRSCFIKQADVLQGIYYFSERFSKEQIKKNFDFYEMYTVHESSLSACIYSIIASKVDNLDKAYELYSRAARLDLDNYNNDTEDGLHITSMSGAWLCIVHGFAGMKVLGNKLHFEPKLPNNLQGYSFNINYRDTTLNIEVDEELVNIKNTGDKSVEINLYGQDYNLEDKIQVSLYKISNNAESNA
ncbi:glycoside hydrolase family 65 protein [Romboutsia weinsteinii]|uniref:Glycoside hydrolase family 65 protein n=1 Tax=Romboutsia weinsteinii TaxID=2020949 RepID=A0A371J5L6_9FIRM|nr:family 65 glycosyl hydrolase domain-containing protein [Romboutsia weinsteinii]RDY28072.1 glycoside hydrolase family 65 protein [Romboutsia weinsteinii]